MKNFKANVLHATLMIVAILGASSCTNNKSKDTKEVAQGQNEQKYERSNTEKDAQFLVNAAEISLEEISLGQMAQQKGNTSHVRDLGKMMEDQHTKSLADLTELAKTKNISLPTSQTENGQVAYETLNKKSGNDFGRVYSSMMVSGHKDAIVLFEKASIECTDLDIKVWATTTLPVLRTHLEQSLECQKLCEKM